MANNQNEAHPLTQLFANLDATFPPEDENHHHALNLLSAVFADPDNAHPRPTTIPEALLRYQELSGDDPVEGLEFTDNQKSAIQEIVDFAQNNNFDRRVAERILQRSIRAMEGGRRVKKNSRRNRSFRFRKSQKKLNAGRRRGGKSPSTKRSR